MSITPAQAGQLRKRIRRLTNACVDDSWKGALATPGEIEAAEKELELADLDLNAYIKELTQ